MDLPEAILLALVQAATEFLPVSSSGHLLLAQTWLGASEIDLRFDVLLHLATVFSVLVYFRKEVAALLRGCVGRGSGAAGPFAGSERRAVTLLVLANVPTALLGWAIHHWFLDAVTRPRFVAAMLVVTGFVLYLGRGSSGRKSIESVGVADALLLGMAQGLAVLPGLSRSGTTIAVALLLGFERGLAARFSLLVSVPAVLGATWLTWADAPAFVEIPWLPYVAGFWVAAVCGYAAVAAILRLVEQDRFHVFAYYLWPVGVVAFFSS
ncbi:MAG: undecaprenyl-diphosphatase [Candidatus Binatia bacterium]|nr:MAG: undecaprenyl-diphosphatase [Candidatus Binatia bacterium]